MTNTSPFRKGSLIKSKDNACLFLAVGEAYQAGMWGEWFIEARVISGHQLGQVFALPSYYPVLSY